MNFRELWLRGEASQKDSINVQRIYIDINDGSLIDGVMLSQIMYWHGYDKRGRSRLRVERNGELWLAKRYEDWWEECRINEHTARKSINRMIESGLLIKDLFKFDGAPTLHIRINWPEFERRIKSIWYERSNGNDLSGRMEMTSQVKSLTETTTETTTEIHAPDEISNGKQTLDPIEHVLSLKKDGVTESSAPNPDDQWIEYSKGFERIYQELTGRTLTYAERSELSEISSAPEADMDIWRKSVSAAILNWTGKREIPHLRRMMEVYRSGGDYDAFAAWKWAEAEPTTHLCEITKINGIWQTGDGQPYKRQKDHIFVHLADDQYWDMDGSLHKSEPGEKLVVVPLDIRIEA